MDFRPLIFSRKNNSVSPYAKNKSVTYNSSSSKNKNYTTKTTNSISNHKIFTEENLDINSNEENKKFNNKYNLLIKEKNIIISKLQNQIKILIYKEEEKEKEKKIRVQKNIINSLNEQKKKFRNGIKHQKYLITTK